MFNRDEWLPTAGQVGGMVGAGVVGALIAIFANAIYRSGADAGDWLQFSGGLLGAALAVFGAVFVEDRKRARDRAERRALIRQPLRAAIDILRTREFLAATDNEFVSWLDPDFFKVEAMRREVAVMLDVIEQIDEAARLASETDAVARVVCAELRAAARGRYDTLAGHQRMIEDGHLEMPPNSVNGLVQNRDPVRIRLEHGVDRLRTGNVMDE